MALEIDTANPAHVRLRFVLDLDTPPGPVSVVGTFNDWTPGRDELRPNVSGTRSVSVEVPYGIDVIFRYLGADGTWFDDDAADAVTESGSKIGAVYY